jgi:citrate lyase subunit beta/citryl-CoA lyase
MQTSTGRGRDRDRARVRHLAMGGVDLQRDLNAGNGNQHTLYVRSHLVVVSRAAGIEPPVDAVWPYLGDEAGLREQAEFARLLGFSGKSAIHPRQLPVLHEVFTPSRRELAWARQVVDAFDAAGGEALRLPTVSSSTCPSRSGPGACSS